MTIPINNLGGSARAQPATTNRPAAKAEDKGRPQLAETGQEPRQSTEMVKLAMSKSSDFDEAKVESIKRAIKEGNYPLDSRRIAESFLSLESLIGPSK